MKLDDFGTVEVKAKIKSLRSTYNLELDKLKKNENSGPGLEDVYVPTVKWFNLMKEIMTRGTLKRQTQSHVPPGEKTAKDNDTKLDQGVEPRGVGVMSPQLPEDTENLIRQQQRQSKKFKPHTRIQQVPSNSRQLQFNGNLNFNSSNEWDIFGNLVAAHLKKLSPQRALDAEMRIFAVLNECCMQDLMAQNFPYTQQNSSVCSIETGGFPSSSGSPVHDYNPDQTGTEFQQESTQSVAAFTVPIVKLED